MVRLEYIKMIYLFLNIRRRRIPNLTAVAFGTLNYNFKQFGRFWRDPLHSDLAKKSAEIRSLFIKITNKIHVFRFLQRFGKQVFQKCFYIISISYRKFPILFLETDVFSQATNFHAPFKTLYFECGEKFLKALNWSNSWLQLLIKSAVSYFKTSFSFFVGFSFFKFKST